MKGSTKIWLIVAAIMIGSGLVIALIGKSMGGDRQVAQWALNGDLSLGPFHISGLGVNVHFSDEDWDSSYEVYKGTVGQTAVADASNIRRLEVEIGGAAVEMRISKDDHFYFESTDAPKYQCYVHGDTLYLKAGAANWSLRAGDKICLYIPEGWKFTDTSIALGGGTISMDELCAEHMEMEVGAGKVNVKSLTVEDIQVEIGAGSVKLAEVTAQQADLEVGMGELTLDGNVTGDLTAECSMGSMEFVITGAESEHNYEVECSLGSVRIGGDSYDGVATERYIDNHANSLYDLSCSVGDIKVTFR